MTSKQMSWEEILQHYNKEWVQLIDYVWPEGTPYPVSGVVRVHAAERKDFLKKVHEYQPKQANSAFIYVGIPPKDPEANYNNFHRLVS